MAFIASDAGRKGAYFDPSQNSNNVNLVRLKTPASLFDSEWYKVDRSVYRDTADQFKNR